MTSTSSSLTWDLSDLYNGMDDPAVAADIKKAGDLAAQITSYRGKIAGLTSTELLQLIHEIEEMYKVMHQLGAYASLLSSTNTGVDEVTRFEKNISEKLTEIGKDTLFIDVEFAKISDEQWQKHLAALELKDYTLTLIHYQRYAKHTLSEPEEKIMADKSQTSSQALTHLFSVTTDTLEVDWNGETMTLSEVLTKFRDPDQTVRKQAAIAIHETLKKNEKTGPAIYNTLIQDKAINCRLRHYDYPEQARFESDDVEKETVDALVKAVSESSDLVQRYYTLKKKILGVDTMYWWDRYAPLPQPQTKIGIDEGKQMVLDAFGEFSPVAKDIAQTMYDKQHIDWLPSKTKRGGAFCSFGAWGKYPFVLLNYTDLLDDVMTLAHELGHAMHDVLAQENNNWMNVWPSLAQAEIASTFGEELIFEKIMAGDLSKQDRIALLMNHIEGNIATIHRQTSMFQFEQKVHTLRAKEGELSKEQLDTLWHDTMKAPFGDTMEWTDEHKNYWMYIPHIVNTPFYVYSYAFAQLCTLSLFNEYRKARQTSPEAAAKFVDTYLKLLRAGGSLTPKDNLAQAGLDISKPEFWQSGLSVVENDITELEKLINT